MQIYLSTHIRCCLVLSSEFSIGFASGKFHYQSRFEYVCSCRTLKLLSFKFSKRDLSISVILYHVLAYDAEKILPWLLNNSARKFSYILKSSSPSSKETLQFNGLEMRLVNTASNFPRLRSLRRCGGLFFGKKIKSNRPPAAVVKAESWRHFWCQKMAFYESERENEKRGRSR